MNIRKIGRIRKYLTYEAVKTLVQCTVTIRLDYCNSLYYGLPSKTTCIHFPCHQSSFPGKNYHLWALL